MSREGSYCRSVGIGNVFNSLIHNVVQNHSLEAIASFALMMAFLILSVFRLKVYGLFDLRRFPIEG